MNTLMMHCRWQVVLLLCLCLYVPLLQASAKFIATRKELAKYCSDPKVVVVASTGRSGSTMLTDVLEKLCSNRKVVKTHLLAPNKRCKAKVIFIFSNPDLAAESALHVTLSDNNFGKQHFKHVETANRMWLSKIQDSRRQTIDHNLLAYDALRCFDHLNSWLFTRTMPSSREEANILAIKYEELWEQNTINALKEFLNLKKCTLPPYKPRGYQEHELLPNELVFRKAYNIGTYDQPIYSAYNDARALWKNAPPFQYLKIL